MGGSDQTWAANLLLSWSGEVGYIKIVSAAVAADCLAAGWSFVRLHDRSADDASLSPTLAAEHLGQLRLLMEKGGLFLPEAEGTLTQAALRAMRGRLVLVSKHAATSLAWPSPDRLARNAPQELPKSTFKVYEAFFNANFPSFDDVNCFNAGAFICAAPRASHILGRWLTYEPQRIPSTSEWAGPG